MRFIDTNVLLYSVSTAPEERPKRERAIAIIEGDDCALSVQVLQEFYVQATRSTRTSPLSHATAVGLIDTWLRFSVQEMTREVMAAAFEIKLTHGFSYWDAAIVAAARALGCSTLLSEDMQHGRVADGVNILNPFIESTKKPSKRAPRRR
jgi:predicted nucleic acid-binding protein